MPIHDWTRVSAGTFHDFHCSWVPEIKKALNKGILPSPYDAMAEQVVGEFGPDVLTLQSVVSGDEGTPTAAGGGTAVAVAPPRVRFTVRAEEDEYVRKQRRLVIRHSSDDRIIGFLEIVSPGNKASRHAWKSFVNKAVACLGRGYHLLLIDLFPPGPRDPQGVHGAVWSEINDDDYMAPPDKPLTLAAYSAGRPKTAYVQPMAVGETLPDMPLFLDPETYVLVPLEATYQSAWEGVPHRWRTVLQSPAT
jgi:hypothetical protein